MKTAHTKIDVAKGAVTMEFGGDMINFKVSESVEHTNDVCSCFAINVIKNKRQERSPPIKKDAFRTTNEEGIGVDHKDCTATTLYPPNMAEGVYAFVHKAALHRNAWVSHLFQFRFPFQLIGCYLLWCRYLIKFKVVIEFTLT